LKEANGKKQEAADKGRLQEILWKSNTREQAVRQGKT